MFGHYWGIWVACQGFSLGFDTSLAWCDLEQVISVPQFPHIGNWNSNSQSLSPRGVGRTKRINKCDVLGTASGVQQRFNKCHPLLIVLWHSLG